MKLTVRHVTIPMRYRFGHARAGRQQADNVIVEAELAGGARGWGECVPRGYVTGESVESVFSAMTRSAGVSVACDERGSFGELVRALWAIDLPALLGNGGPAPAAAAALELAVLDAAARREDRPSLDALSELPALASLVEPQPRRTVRQTLTIGDDLDGALARAGTLAGPLDVKVKIGFGDEDLVRGRALRDRFGDIDLRADANAVWDRAAAAVALARLAPLGLSSVEEPLRDRDLEGCAALRRAGTKIMLDESLCTLVDAERAIAAGAADLFNLRLSKCGGLLPTLKLVQLAERSNIGWQLGCMVGETGILSCLGRAFVARVRGARYFESTVPTKSLEADLTDAAIDHLPGTRDTPVPTGPGFGAAVDRVVLDRYTVTKLEIDGALATSAR